MPADDRPIDEFDPRFTDLGDRGGHAAPGGRARTLVDSAGPGASPSDPKVRILRVAVPLLAIAGTMVIGLVFWSGLRPSGATMVLGPEQAVQAAVADRPRRVCLNNNNPCAWLTFVDDRLLAFNTNGPLPEEYGRLGVSWCPTSGWFGANSTGSRWDQRGRYVDGPSIRSLDRFTILRDADGVLSINFASLTAGVADHLVDEVSPPDGPHCEEIPFARDSDLDLTAIAPPSAGEG